MNKVKFWGAVAVAALVALFCVGWSTIDSCQRHNKTCFGTTWTK